jgi:hypothetical protein
LNKPMREGFVAAEEVQEDAAASNAAAATDMPAARTEPDLPEWPLTIPLMHKPLMKGNEEINELIFREPTAMDIIRSGGNPCRIEVVEQAGGQVTYSPVIDDAKMMRVMANLSGLLEPQLQKMDPRDYNSCAHRLRRFFLPEQGIW